MDLRKKVVLVTGGTSGIGLGIAVALRDEGATVAVCGSRERNVTEAAEKASVHGFVCDITRRDAVKRMFTDIAARLGGVDVLVNSAGTNVANRSMSTVDPEDFDRVLAVNTTGTFNCIHAALPAMREKGEGLIVNIVSVGGRRVLEVAGAPYCVSKFATAALGTYVGLEDTKNGIRVTNIYPGETDTPLLDARPVPPPPERRAAMLKPEDVAACVVLVAKLPQRANVPELVSTPAHMLYG
jgi:NAD(P)-dependent dehydrogenase (short-subunit alcohol dehydrogenase family)